MKYVSLAILLLVINNYLFGQKQDITAKIAIEACSCIEVSTVTKADSCLTSSMAKVISATENKTEVEFIGTVEGIRSALTTVHQLIQDNCVSYRSQVLENRKSVFYRKSENEQANVLYSNGTQKMQEGNFEVAVKDFKQAIKLDSRFVLALDHMAICYRQLKRYDKSIDYYKKSLAIFPEGDLALMNLAVVYSLKNDQNSALKTYGKLINLYPDDPEGYFGVAKVSLILDDLERATENALIAHILYSNTNSSYLKDSETLLALIYGKLKKQNRTDLLDEKARELNIDIKIN